MNFKISASIAFAFFIAGCASVTEPVRAGGDTFLVNSQASGTWYSWGEVKNMALTKANEHCDSIGKKMVFESDDYSGARSWVPIEAHIKYRCVEK